MKKYTSLIRKKRREIVIGNDEINNDNIPVLTDSFENTAISQISTPSSIPSSTPSSTLSSIPSSIPKIIPKPRYANPVVKSRAPIPKKQMMTPISNMAPIQQTSTMKEFLINSGVPFDGDFIKIPKWCKRVKLDIGLSGNAPQSKIWLDKEDDLLIFAFEPVPENINMIKTGGSPWPIRLNPSDIGEKIYIIPCALSNVENGTTVNFNVTANDTGCSSMFEPVTFPIKETVNVPVWSLFNFFQHFPFHIIPYIDFIKTDCQGADLDILKGAKEFIDKLAIITIEPENSQYKKTDNGVVNIKFYLESKNFNKVQINTTEDPTFYNQKLLNEINNNNITCYQRG